MAHYQRPDPLHSAPAEPPTPPRRRPAGVARPPARIDCDTCPIAGTGCGGCMVALLGPVRFRLDAAEQDAVEVLCEHGLVDAQEAAGAYAVPDLPEWVVASWPQGRPQEPVTSGERLRALG